MRTDGSDRTRRLGGEPDNGFDDWFDQDSGLEVEPEGELDRTIMRPKPLEAPPAYEPVRYDPQPYAAPAAPAAPSRRPARRMRTRDDGSPKHGCLAALLWPFALVVFALCVARLLPLEASTGRLIPEAVSLVPWAIVPAAIIFILALLWHRHALAIITCVPLVLLLWWHVGFFWPAGSLTPEARATTSIGAIPSSDDAVARVMTLNVFNGGADASEVVACVRDNGVEVLALQEVTWSFLDELAAAGIYDYLPYVAYSEAGAWDNGGLNCLFSLSPLSDVSGSLLPTELSAMCAGDVEVAGHTLRFVSCHPSSPHFGGEELWSSGLATIGELSEYDHTYVIMGDFNSTWNHARFRALLGESFVDASQQAGEGFHMTWPSGDASIAGYGLPPRVAERIPALIEIDHIVYAADAGIFVGELQTVRIGGTDHYALIGTLEVR